MTGLAWLRIRKGYSQGELAQLLGTHQGVVSNWERGTKTPRVSNLRKLAKVFDMTIAELLDVIDKGEVDNG